MQVHSNCQPNNAQFGDKVKGSNTLEIVGVKAKGFKQVNIKELIQALYGTKLDNLTIVRLLKAN